MGTGSANGEQDTEQDNQLENHEKAVVRPHDTPQDTPQATERVERLVGAVQREMSRAELQAALKLLDRRSFIDTYLKPALGAGLIEMTLPDRPTSRNQRYRRTPAGEVLARQLMESSKMNSASIVSKVWSFFTTLRDDGVGYGDYLEQLTYLIFHKMADEYAKPPYSRDIGIPKSFAWTSPTTRRGAELEAHYVTLLRRLGSP